MADYRESRGSFASASGSPKKPSSYGNDFIRLSSSISNNVQKIQSNVRQIKAMMATLADKPNDTRTAARLHEILKKTNTLAKDTGKYVQDLNKIPKNSDVPEERQHRIQRDRVVSEFTKALNDFQDIQKQAKDKVKGQVARDKISIREMRSVGPGTEQETAILGLRDQIQIQSRISNVELELMQEREEELRKLESDIMDVNQIFKDLGAMVHEQGEVVDTIESNVNSAVEHVEEGKNHLVKAHELQTKVRRKRCIIIIVVVVVVVVILIIIILASVLSSKK